MHYFITAIKIVARFELTKICLFILIKNNKGKGEVFMDKSID